MNNSQRNHQKTVDRMRKKMITNKGGQKICLVLLIRNQPNTVNTLLDSLKSVINMISVIEYIDSNKSIIDSILDWSKNNNIPVKINIDEFLNLSYNKTNSIKISKKEFHNADYFLLSELDFIWETNNFDKESLSENKYDIVQNTDYYRSTRLLSAKINWVCHLSTYEYWINANDKPNDNGCLLKTLSIKENLNNNNNDKVSLLFQDLNDKTISKYDRSRVKFYLGYTLKYLDRFEEAISYSLERIVEGGCKEEIYYSLYNIGLSYEKWGWKLKKTIAFINKEIKSDDDVKFIEKWNTKNLIVNQLLTESAKLFNEAILHYKKAYEFRSTRAESLYSTAKLYRKLGVNEIYILAYQTIMMGKKIKCPTDYLFLNKACYDYLFDVELVMIAYNLPNNKMEGKEALTRILDRNDLPIKTIEKILSISDHYK